jgi:putative FmdB family regulatory protein
MPIYAYRCSNCGLEQESMQKMSDAPLTTCPQCKTETLVKQLTAAGIQLKGSGWYATDFKGGQAKSETKSDNPPPCQGGTGSCACG